MSVNIQNNQETTSEKQTQNVVFSLESLTAKYDSLLLQYKQISADYTNYLSQQHSREHSFTTIQGQSYWGTGTTGDQSVYTDVSSVNVCQAMCVQNSNCSGATYNLNANGVSQCFLRTGESQTIPSGENDYAIVSLGMFYLIQLKDLNTQLSNTNNQILNIIKSTGETLYSSQVVSRFIKGNTLEENYNELNRERERIEESIKKFQSLDEEQNDTNLVINQNYYSYILLTFIAILCIYILVKVSSGSSENTYIQSGGTLSDKTYYIICGMIIVSLSVYFFFINNKK